MIKLRQIKIPYWNSFSFPIKIGLILFLVFLFVLFALNKKYLNHNPSTNNYTYLTKQINLIKEQLKNIAFTVPNTIYYSNREQLKVLINKELPELANLNQSILTLQLNMSEDIARLEKLEQESIYLAYSIINTSIKKLQEDFTMIQTAPAFGDISQYIHNVQNIIENLVNFPKFYTSENNNKEDKLKEFSLNIKKH